VVDEIKRGNHPKGPELVICKECDGVGYWLDDSGKGIMAMVKRHAKQYGLKLDD